MKKLLALLLLTVALAHAQTSNTFNAAQFAGNDVGTKVTAAQNACNPTATYPCVIILDPSLANFAPGTLPTKCTQCVWVDWRTRGSVTFSQLNGATSVVPSVKDYGAKCDGTTDDAAAFQAATTANPDGAISLPPGTCAIGTAINVTTGLNVLCPIRGTTVIKFLSTTMVGFNVQTQSGFQMSNCQLVSNTKQTAGAAIQISGPVGSPSTNNSGTNINNIYCSFQWICVSMVKADTFRLHDITPVGTQFAGIQVDSQANGDSGDSFITNCIFSSDVAAPGNTYGVRWITGSTIIANNKFFHHTYGVRVEFASTTGTGQLLVLGNRFEPQDQETVGLIRQSGQTATLGSVIVRENFFRSDGAEVSATPTFVKVNAPLSGASWISNIYIGGNIFLVGTKATAVNFASGTDGNDSLVADNLIIGAAGTSQGVVLAAGLTGVQVRAQHFASVTTPYTNATTMPGVFFPDKVAFGVTTLGAALTEQISMPNNKFLAGRTAANSAWKQLIGLNASDQVSLDSSGVGTTFGGALLNGTKLLQSPTAPTISSGFGTSPTIATNNGTAAFTVNVGTGVVSNTGVIGLPAATNGWNCDASDITTTSATVFVTKQTASTTTSVTLGNFNTSAVASPWVASDILSVKCTAR